MDFNFPNIGIKITKDFLLEKNSEETYMSTYLGIPLTRGLFRSPLRSDKKPTCHLYRNHKGDLIFHDFGTGFHANFIGVVMELNHCSYNEALDRIAADFGYVKNIVTTPIKIRKTNEVIKEKQETVIQITPKEFTESELKWWDDFGISKLTLDKYKVFSCEHVFLNNIYFKSSSQRTYLFGYYCGKKESRELWRIYMPKTPEFKFVSNTSSNIIQGSKMLPKKGNLVVVTKSLKDVMVLYELGIPAIAPCSEMLFLSKVQLNALKKRFKNIVVFYDNDIPGIEGMRKIKRQYPELRYFWIPKSFEVKDTSDFVKKYGKEKAVEFAQQLVKNYYE